jgi:Flp pilus assembly pilin Flp
MKFLQHLLQCIARWSRERSQPGQGLVEYALILSFVALVVVAALGHLQPAIATSLNNTNNSLLAH